MCALLLGVESGSEESKGWSLSHRAFSRNEEVQQYVPPREQVCASGTLGLLEKEEEGNKKC